MIPELATVRLRMRGWRDEDLPAFAALNANPRVMAHFTPCVEVGWRLAVEFWGRGYATEAATEALAFGFEKLALEEIVSFTVPANLASRRVMERLGMTHDPADDFDYPRLPEGHRIRAHVLYRMKRTGWQGKGAR